MNVTRYLVAPGFFRVLKIPVLEGRDFEDSDDPSRPPVVVVNQAFAMKYFHGANPLGRRIRYRAKWATVVGMARDSKYFDIEEAPPPHLFAAFRQYPADSQAYFFIKAAGSPAAVMAGFRRQVMAVDSGVGTFDSMLLTEWTDVTLLPQKVVASLMGVVGLVSLILAALGLYTLMAYAVTQRTQEIGIRMALGAQPREVLREMLRRGLFLTLPGLAAGLGAALALARLASSKLVGVSVYDPPTYAGAALFLAAVAFLATWLPAHRATLVDPMIALRAE